MNHRILLLLMSILSLDVSAKGPFDNDSNANYIELQDMLASATHAPLPHDPYQQVPYQDLGASTSQTPDNDLNAAKPTRSTMQRRIFHNTFPAPQGCLLVLKACLSCCCKPEPHEIPDSGDTL